MRETTDSRPPAIFLMGPTACGKTALAIEWAQRFGLGVISVDSAMVYRGMDIGSAKPQPSVLARCPHALIDIKDPEQNYSAAEFRHDALLAMHRVAQAGQIPLLVGGTGLYFRALERGLSELPDADPGLRAEIAQAGHAQGWPALHRQLTVLDPVAAARIHPHDPQRIQRALEVIRLTGRPLSAQQGGERGRLPWRLLKLALLPHARSWLHDRIAQRVDDMIGQGFLDEVRRLRARPGLTPAHASMRAVGYRQAWQCLDGAFPADSLRERMVAATRQLAKRQLTWLRREWDALTAEPTDPGLERHLRGFIGQGMLRHRG